MKTILFFLASVISISAFAQPAGYGYGKQVLIQSSQVSGVTDFTDFTALISLIDTDLRTTVNGGHVENTNGYDIVFTLDDCSTILDHQIEKYVPSTGEYIVWVKIPTLYAASNTNIHLYYGNNSVSVDPSTTNVWNIDHGAVYHMNQSPIGTSPQLIDYTANTNDGTANGSMVAGDLVTGKIGDGINFDGSNDFIDCGASTSTSPSGSVTVSAWIFSDGISGHIINRGGGWDDSGYSLFHLSNHIRIELQRIGEKDIVDNAISINNWHYVALTYNITGGTIRCFIDGAQQGNTGTHTGPIGAPVENLNLGRKEQNAFYFDGIIDEARVINTYRSPDWLATEYNNQNSPSTFYTVSSEMVASTFCSVLPIELVSFECSIENDKINLNWQTASELNNDYFTIERSKNGFDWNAIKTIDGAGNSSSLLNYSTIDLNPYKRISYYRLKQTDFDGEYSYSNTVSVDIQNVANNKIEIYPNPTSNKITIKGNSFELERINIYNILGENVTNQTLSIENSKQEIVIDLSELSAGIYIVKTKTTANKLYKQ